LAGNGALGGSHCRCNLNQQETTMPFYERQPYVQALHLILAEVLRGEILVPRFQRPGTEDTWTPEQRQALLDSIYRGFPVGTILLWSTKTDISFFPKVGGFPIPNPPEGRPNRFLLDGHQRLSTLVQILGAGLLGDAEPTQMNQEEWWFFDLQGSSADSKENFIWLDTPESDNAMHLPLHILLNRSKLNQWIRSQDLEDESVGKAEELRDCLRDYQMPIAILQTDNLDEVTESFKRVNSSGTKMGDFNMVAALAYQEDFDLQQIFQDARAEHLKPIRWDEIADSDILRICVGITGDDPTALNVKSLAIKLRADPAMVEQAFTAIVQTTGILKSCGIHGHEMLPYSWQLIVMALVLHKHPKINQKKHKAFEKWFWLTTYGGVFATGNKSVVYRQSKQALLDMLQDKSEVAMERYIRRNVYWLDRFDFRAVRTKACVLAMARFQDNGKSDGPAHRVLQQGTDALQVLTTKGMRSTWWHLVIETEEGQVAAIRKQANAEGWQAQAAALAAFGIDIVAHPDILSALKVRRDRILKAEEDFVARLGFTWIDRLA
jgi:Protein of unknown function DUF262